MAPASLGLRSGLEAQVNDGTISSYGSMLMAVKKYIVAVIAREMYGGVDSLSFYCIA